jgi:hypothetical protein
MLPPVAVIPDMPPVPGVPLSGVSLGLALVPAHAAATAHVNKINPCPKRGMSVGLSADKKKARIPRGIRAKKAV